MTRHNFARARENLQRAKNDLALLSIPFAHDDIPDLITAKEPWLNFVTNIALVYKCLKGELTGPFFTKVWQDMHRDQRNDPLLQYLLHSRNAKEHPEQDIITIGSKNPIKLIDGNAIPAVFRGRKLSGEPFAKTSYFVPVVFGQFVRKLQPVTSRDQKTYPVPSTHFGNAINPITPERIAELAIIYLEAKIALVESHAKEELDKRSAEWIARHGDPTLGVTHPDFPTKTK